MSGDTEGWALQHEPADVLHHYQPRRERGALVLAVGKVLSDRLKRYAVEALIRLDQIEDDDLSGWR